MPIAHDSGGTGPSGRSGTPSVTQTGGGSLLQIGTGGAPGGTSGGGGSSHVDASGGAVPPDAGSTGIGGREDTASCVGLRATCGPNKDESCCVDAMVPGGAFNRSNDAARYPATVSAFWLDKYEVTVGRFRRFVDAFPTSKPSPGAGKHPKLEATGWQADWNSALPPDKAELVGYLKCNPLFHTWTDQPGANENKPLNCVSWYMTYAFCAWDGGRLATDAELNFAATGGAEQRKFPWGDMDPTRDATLAVWGCFHVGGTCQGAADITVVGSAPAGNGRWGHADLAGSLWERVLDIGSQDHFPIPCTDCAALSDDGASPANSIVRGGAFWAEDPVSDDLNNGNRSIHNAGPAGIASEQGSGTVFGARCARDR